jgi:DNA-binding transcriptional regulator/RsmH inhibitor MraZ
MKNLFSRLISLLLLICVIVGSLASCELIEKLTGGPADQPEHVHVDYVEELKLDRNSGTNQLEVKMKRHIDGDTTHFIDPIGISVDGVIKARYLAVNTPESTGRIEEWGKAASKFTQSKLENAHSIIIESNDASWNKDGNGRFLISKRLQRAAGINQDIQFIGMDDTIELWSPQDLTKTLRTDEDFSREFEDIMNAETAL